jgi:hypothetical protein
MIGEKSPNWDKCSEAIKSLSAGQNLPGFPFNEGWPTESGYYLLILGNGRVEYGTVDVSPEHVSDNVLIASLRSSQWGLFSFSKVAVSKIGSF